MSGKSLQHVPRPAARSTSAPGQDRFRFLVDRIEKQRRARAAWDELVIAFKTSEVARVHPLRATLKEVTRETVFVIDRLLEQKGWSRADRSALQEIACRTAEALLRANPDDAEIRTIFDRHSSQSFQEMKQEELEDLKQDAKEYMGIDLDGIDIESEDDLIERVYEQMKNDQARDRESSAEHRKSTGQQRAEDSTQSAKQFLREIYRKLASAVHPDREADAARRAEKTELMQRINRAYATNDLLALLEAQLQLELIDPDHLSKISGKRLQQFNRLLSQQLEAAKAELRSLQDAFRGDHGLPPGDAIEARDLHLFTQRRARELRVLINQQQRFLDLLANKSATKRWLKEQRRFEDRINRAYATNDLLALLEAQLQLELIDPDHVSKISGKRLQQFNRVLCLRGYASHAPNKKPRRRHDAQMVVGAVLDDLLGWGCTRAGRLTRRALVVAGRGQPDVGIASCDRSTDRRAVVRTQRPEIFRLAHLHVAL